MSERARWQLITDRSQLPPLIEEAARDNHRVLWPTHIAMKGDEIAGYASLGTVALVNLWSHSQRMTARDSLTLWKEMEQNARAIGFPAICVPCSPDSPFRPLMPRMGYGFVMESGFFIKSLNPKGGQ